MTCSVGAKGEDRQQRNDASPEADNDRRPVEVDGQVDRRQASDRGAVRTSPQSANQKTKRKAAEQMSGKLPF